MKKNIFYSLGVLLAFALVFTSCDKEDDYDFDSYVPILMGDVSGPNIGFASGLAPLTYSVTHRGGSTYNWAVSGIDAVIELDAKYPSVAYITFAQSDVDAVATITVTETANGNTSNELTYTVNLLKFRPIEITGFSGSWTGDDAWYDGDVTIAVNTDGTLAVTGLSVGFIQNWWGEAVIAGGTITMTVNLENGTVAIARQYIYTTDWEGDPYDYEIEGVGLWDNTGASPTLTIEYDIYYPGDAVGLAATYSPDYLPTPYMTAALTLGDAKRVYVTPSTLLMPDFK